MPDQDKFNALAETWDNNPRIAKMAEAFCDSIERHVPLCNTMRTLDFGCGTGQVALRLQPLLQSIALVDTSEGMLNVLKRKIARQSLKNLSIHCGDLFQNALAEGGFDLAYTLMALHHVGDLEPVFGRFQHLLKPGGYLCIGDLEPEDGSFHGKAMEVHKGFEPEILGQSLSRQGFEVVCSERMLVIRKEIEGGEARSFPLFFLLARKI